MWYLAATMQPKIHEGRLKVWIKKYQFVITVRRRVATYQSEVLIIDSEECVHYICLLQTEAWLQRTSPPEADNFNSKPKSNSE